MNSMSENALQQPAADEAPFTGQVSQSPGVGPGFSGNQPHPQLLAAALSYIAGQGGGQGLFPTAMDGVNIVSSFSPMMPMRQIYRPSLCLVIQGGKEINFGENRLEYGAMECLVVSVGLPATGRIVNASVDAPFIGMTIDIDVAAMRDVLFQLEMQPSPSANPGPCVFVGRVDEPLVDCVLRLIRLSATPKAVPILYPSLMREICYWLLTSPHGGDLCGLALPETNTERVVKAIYLLRDRFSETLRMERLAEAARMSASSFHQHFKALTSMTPLQFQKQLRLLEARRLMVTDAATVAEAAYKVGYESASQFSREYSRTFGIAPKRDAMHQQRLHAEYGSRQLRAAE